MGNAHSNTDTLNWNNLKTENVSSIQGGEGENLNYLFDKLDIPKEEKNNLSEVQLSELYNQIFNQLGGKKQKSDSVEYDKKTPETSSTSSLNNSSSENESSDSESLNKYISSSSGGKSSESDEKSSISSLDKSSQQNKTSSVSSLNSADVPSLNTSDLELVDPSK
jgi:hypothetical protein